MKITALLERLADSTKAYVARTLEPVQKRIGELEKRIVELEARATRYRFKWRAGESYRDGDIVLHENALWSCDGGAAPGDTPGTEGAKWSLILRGRE